MEVKNFGYLKNSRTIFLEIQIIYLLLTGTLQGMR